MRLGLTLAAGGDPEGAEILVAMARQSEKWMAYVRALCLGYRIDPNAGQRFQELPDVTLTGVVSPNAGSRWGTRSAIGSGRTRVEAMPSATVRSTKLRDRPGVLRLVGAAFSDHLRDGHEEVEIVERTWALISPHETIDLVAIDEGAIVGHVLAAAGRVDEMPLLAVAPLAVAPAHQGRGIGTALMTELLQRAEQAGWGAVVLLGQPDYYNRFGFKTAAALGIVYPPVGPESPYFQARRFRSDEPVPQGSFRYIWEEPETSP